MHWTGHRDGPPLAAPGQVAWDEAGIHAAFGIVSALFGHDRFGGQTSGLRRARARSQQGLPDRALSTSAPSTNGAVRSGIGIPPCGRGNAATARSASPPISDHHWDAFLAMLDHPDELSEPSLHDPQVRRQIFDGLQDGDRAASCRPEP